MPVSEKKVWDIMVSNFRLTEDRLDEYNLNLLLPKKSSSSQKDYSFQLFEVVVAAIFARMKPDYSWSVTPGSGDGGIDFMGKYTFLRSDLLNVEAAITIGGQCKKNESGSNLDGSLLVSVTDMLSNINPHLYLLIISSSMTKGNIKALERRIQHITNHYNIFNRNDINILIKYNSDVAFDIMRDALNAKDFDNVRSYFNSISLGSNILETSIDSPSSVLAGEVFRVRVDLQSPLLSSRKARVSWERPDRGDHHVTVIAPVDVESERGAELQAHDGDSILPVKACLYLELLSYDVGERELGALSIMVEGLDTPHRIDLPSITVIENLRPHFYDEPYRYSLAAIEDYRERSQAGRIECVGVTGAGGSGKSRLCEEICIEARCLRCEVVAARQNNTTDYPRRILANLLMDLCDSVAEDQVDAKIVTSTLARLNSDIAAQADSAIQGLIGNAGKTIAMNDMPILAKVFTLLIAAKARCRPLVVHLHDLHWCLPEILEFIDKVIWQLRHINKAEQSSSRKLSILFLLEGRKHEHRDAAKAGWSTLMYEKFLKDLGCPVVTCPELTPEQSRTFTLRVFEGIHSSNRKLPKALLVEQKEVAKTIARISGANPFHILEHVKHLQQQGFLRQNPKTGLIYLKKPVRITTLPKSVYQCIKARWEYLFRHDKEMATLIWATGLLDDQLPDSLFQHIWASLAPNTCLMDLQETGFLNLPEEKSPNRMVSFRHENYFHALRTIQVEAESREAIVTSYQEWFSSLKIMSPRMRLMHARVELASQKPNFNRAKSILRKARAWSCKNRDYSLEARILGVLLDEIFWAENAIAPVQAQQFLMHCKWEVELADLLILTGHRDLVESRICHVLEELDKHLDSRRRPTPSLVEKYHLLRYELMIKLSRAAFNNQRPDASEEVANDAIGQMQLFTQAHDIRQLPVWKRLEMELYHVHGVALALSGSLSEAIRQSRYASKLAKQLFSEDPNSIHVTSTHANILMCENPHESLRILEDCFDKSKRLKGQDTVRLKIQLNRAMARILIVSQSREGDVSSDASLLRSASSELEDVYYNSQPVGRTADAAAAALLLGIIHALNGNDAEVEWSARAVALATQSRQLETLWRAQLNLAHGLNSRGEYSQDSAEAAVDIIMESLTEYAHPETSERYRMICVPLAHAVRYLLLGKNQKGERTLRKLPNLRKLFKDVGNGVLHEDREEYITHEHISIRDVEYVIY